MLWAALVGANGSAAKHAALRGSRKAAEWPDVEAKVIGPGAGLYQAIQTSDRAASKLFGPQRVDKWNNRLKRFTSRVSLQAAWLGHTSRAAPVTVFSKNAASWGPLRRRPPFASRIRRIAASVRQSSAPGGGPGAYDQAGCQGSRDGADDTV